MKTRRNVLLVTFLVLATGLSTYFVVTGSSAGGSSPIPITVGGETQPNAAVGPLANRPQATPIAPGTNLATANSSVIAGGLQGDLNALLSAKLSSFTFDASTQASNLESFLQAEQTSLRSVSITPTVLSSVAQPDGSLLVNFTVAVTVAGGQWPNTFGTLTATLEPQGTIMVSHSSLCALASPIAKTRPF
jgi:hypothetical protein